MAVQRSMDEVSASIQTQMKEAFTVIHPVVEWRSQALSVTHAAAESEDELAIVTRHLTFEDQRLSVEPVDCIRQDGTSGVVPAVVADQPRAAAGL